MTTATQITVGFHKILDTLSEKEKSIIISRIGFNWVKETLQEIGDKYWITRERVRQIEDVWIKKIWRIVKTSELIIIQNSWEKNT